MLRILIYRVPVAKRMVCARHFAAAACGRGKTNSTGMASAISSLGFRGAVRAPAVPAGSTAAPSPPMPG
jgi:hypothetical protein